MPARRPSRLRHQPSRPPLLFFEHDLRKRDLREVASIGAIDDFDVVALPHELRDSLERDVPAGTRVVQLAVRVLLDKVAFGAAKTGDLFVGTGAEAGSTINNAIIGKTKVVNAAGGMQIDFTVVTTSHFIADETTVVASATTLKAAENAAVNAFGGSGVVYFSFHGNEYFIATDNAEAAVSSSDAIVKLVGVTVFHHATNNFGLVTLHV